jgi:hydrogenase expression/formation protein HypC
VCLGVPGRVVELDESDALPQGTVDFAGVRRSVCLVYVPGVGVGDWVIVHAGFAIQTLDEASAKQTLAWLGAPERDP